MKTPSLLLSLLLSFSGACAMDDGTSPSKEDIRDLPADEKADDATDWCEIFDWYGDQECDDFCLQPDPDCAPVCEPSDCGVQPDFQPMICDDGSFIFPSVTCEADELGGCGWHIESESCPEEPVCEPSDCGVQPDFQPRVCPDGTLIFPSLTCEPNGFGSCGWNLESESCS